MKWWENDFLVFGLSCLALLTALYIILFLRGLKKPYFRLVSFFLALLAVSGMVFSTWYTVDEGDAVVLTQFKKIFTTITTPGPKMKFPWMETYIFPKRLSTYTETIDARSSDGLVATFDITTQIRVDPHKLADIYRNVAKTYAIMASNIITPALREIVRNTISGFSANEVYLKRGILSQQLEEDVRRELLHRHVILEDLQLRKTVLPPKIEEAIQIKLEKQQTAQSMEFEKIKAEKEAEIRLIEAKGIAEAQKIINSTLTTTYLQHEAIGAYKILANSSNATFVIMPTDGKSTGLPMILNTKK